MSKIRKLLTLSCLTATALFSVSVRAQDVWTVTNLHPAGAKGSRLVDTDGTQQVGNITVGDVTHAGLWSGSAESFVDLHPALAEQSNALGVGGGQQVGYAILNDRELPVAWSGTANSLQSYLPNGVPSGRIFSTNGVQQGGQIDFPLRKAIIWSGEAEKLVNLHPQLIAEQSGVRDSNGSRQVGFAVIGASTRAAMWGGSAESFIDMNPPGAVASTAEDVEPSQKFDVQMVGHSIIGGVLRATLWIGQANGYVDLHPAGAISSQAFATDGTHQVGVVRYDGGLPRAGLWRGTAGSFVNLHEFLSADFTSSDAAGVWTDGATTLVAGAAFNSVMGRHEAILWKLEAPEPLTLRVLGKRKRFTASKRIVVRGTATNAEQVEVKVDRRGFRPASGTSAWEFPTRLERGRNRIVVRALDSSGEATPGISLVVIRK